jgi:hypothetical protein
MINKHFPKEYINISYNEVRDAMKHTISTTDAIDKKAHGILTICIAILFAVCGFLFAKDNIEISHIVSCTIMIIGASISTYLLYQAYKAREYHIFGDRMDEILDEDPYYHDEDGVKIYLIERYKNKIEINTKNNNLKSQKINKSMSILLYTGIIAFSTYAIFTPPIIKWILSLSLQLVLVF